METDFLASENHCLRYFWRSPSFLLVSKHFSVQKRKYWFLFRTFFPARWIHYLNYRKSYLKLLLLLLFLLAETVFFNFFQTLIRLEAVFRCSKVAFFNEPFILASGNGFFGKLQTLCFNSEFLSAGGLHSWN